MHSPTLENIVSWIIKVWMEQFRHQLRTLMPRTELYLNLLRNLHRIRGTTVTLTWCQKKLLSEASSVRRKVQRGPLRMIRHPDMLSWSIDARLNV